MADESDARRSATTGIIVLAVLAVVYSLYFARSLLVPIAFAILLNFLFSPLVRLMRKIRIPSPVAAAVIVLGLIAITAFGSYKLSRPAQKLLGEAPATISRVQASVGKLMSPVTRVTATASEVARSASAATDSTSPAKVEVVGPSIASRLTGTAQHLVGGFIEVVLLLFFLLAGGDLFLEKTIRVIPLLQDKKKAVRIARDVESAVSVYLISNLGINLMAGVMVAGAMWALGMPNPVLWGVLTAAFEFIPFLGPLAMMVMLAVTAVGTYDSLGRVLLAPGAYFLVNIIQGNIITTLVLGRRLALNSVALFVGLTFWFWIWGIPGAFIGVPLLSIMKICCDHIEVLNPVGEFLGARHEPTQAATPPEIAVA